MSQKEINVDLFDEVKRLKALLRKVNEWRNSPEVQGTFSVVSIHSYAPKISKEFQDKYYPMFEELNREFPVAKQPIE